jgi:hypothetical protein
MDIIITMVVYKSVLATIKAIRSLQGTDLNG